MILIKRFITVIFSLFGGAIGLIAMGIFNWGFHLGLSFGDVLLYGLAGGIFLGITAGYIIMYYIINKTRTFIFNRLGSLFKLDITKS